MTHATIDSRGNQSTAPINKLIAVAEQALQTTKSGSYERTLALWGAWCAENAVNVLDLQLTRVLAFLNTQNVTASAGQRQLAALRKLAQIAYLLTPTEEVRHTADALRPIKIPTGGEHEEMVNRRALSPAQTDEMLHVWDLPTNIHRRNRALIAVLALGAQRRMEVVGLRWRDVDFEQGVITVRHSKADKLREVSLVGDSAIEALRVWQLCVPEGREISFCPVLRGDHIGFADVAISNTDVERIAKATEVLSGIEF